MHYLPGSSTYFFAGHTQKGKKTQLNVMKSTDYYYTVFLSVITLTIEPTPPAATACKGNGKRILHRFILSKYSPPTFSCQTRSMPQEFSVGYANPR